MQKLWHGVFWKIISCGCFAGINALVRYLSGGSALFISKPLPIYTIMFFQNLIGMLIVASWMSTPLLQPQPLRNINGKRLTLHVLRIVSAAIGIGLWYVSLRYIPITQVVALSFIAPILTTIGAVIFLRENFNLQRKLAVIFSIVGGFMIARPDRPLLQTSINDFNWYMLLPLLAACTFTIDKLLTRKLLANNESSSALAWYLLAFMSPLCLLPTAYYGWVSPDITTLPWIILLGILAALAHYTFNRAYAVAEVTTLLPFGAAKIVLSALISYLAFAEIPHTIDLWVGITIITFSTIILGVDHKLLLAYIKKIFYTKLLRAT